jgi:hypothetical protein
MRGRKPYRTSNVAAPRAIAGPEEYTYLDVHGKPLPQGGLSQEEFERLLRVRSERAVQKQQEQGAAAGATAAARPSLLAAHSAIRSEPASGKSPEVEAPQHPSPPKI